mgnify:CR=1 FL=1
MSKLKNKAKFVKYLMKEGIAKDEAIQIVKGLNEAPDHDLFKKLYKIDDMIIKLMMKYTAKADVKKVAHSWMAGLHAKLKKHGIKI